MANELLTPKLTADVTYYALIWNEAGQVWNGSTFETFADANYSTYTVALTELGTSSGRYAADRPGALSATTHYTYEVMFRAGGSPAITDVMQAQGELGPSSVTANVTQSMGYGVMAYGTVTIGSSTTSVVSSSCTPVGAIADQFKNRTLIFTNATTTTTLRSVAVAISASSNAAAPTFTVATLPATPASGDTFIIV
mgnify:CR=1 FL=1